MDKDNRDDFTFAKLSDIKHPVTFRMCVRISLHGKFSYSINDRSQLEGVRRPKSVTELLQHPELRFHGIQSAYVFSICSRGV